MVFFSLGVIHDAHAKAPTQRGAPAGDRAALVIGNNDYLESPLRNAENDALLIARNLTRAGFLTTTKINLSARSFAAELQDFTERLQAMETFEAVFFYDGHAVQFGKHLYLIPVDTPQTEEAILRDAISLDRIITHLNESRIQRAVLLMNTCRVSLVRGEMPQEGFDTSKLQFEAFIAFSTTPGSEIFDGIGRHSIFVEEFSSWVLVPGVRVDDAVASAVGAILEEHRWYEPPLRHSSLLEPFRFMEDGRVPLIPLGPGDLLIGNRFEPPEEEEEDDDDDEPPPPPPAPDTPDEDTESAKRREIGLNLLLGGAIISTIGAGLLGGGAVAQRDAEALVNEVMGLDPASQDAYLDREGRYGQGLYTAGALVLSAGLATLTTGGVFTLKHNTIDRRPHLRPRGGNHRELIARNSALFGAAVTTTGIGFGLGYWTVPNNARKWADQTPGYEEGTPAREQYLAHETEHRAVRYGIGGLITMSVGVVWTATSVVFVVLRRDKSHRPPPSLSLSPTYGRHHVGLQLLRRF